MMLTVCVVALLIIAVAVGAIIVIRTHDWITPCGIVALLLACAGAIPIRLGIESLIPVLGNNETVSYFVFLLIVGALYFCIFVLLLKIFKL